MPRTTEKHFTARVEVQEVRKTTDPGTGRGDDKTTREVIEVETMTVRAATLDGLRDKLAARVALLEVDE